jgi:hypothetical protein
MKRTENCVMTLGVGVAERALPHAVVARPDMDVPDLADEVRQQRVSPLARHLELHVPAVQHSRPGSDVAGRDREVDGVLRGSHGCPGTGHSQPVALHELDILLGVPCREFTSSGRWPASSERSAILAARSAVLADLFADLIDANVATARTRVPAARLQLAASSQARSMAGSHRAADGAATSDGDLLVISKSVTSRKMSARRRYCPKSLT